MTDMPLAARSLLNKNCAHNVIGFLPPLRSMGERIRFVCHFFLTLIVMIPVLVLANTCQFLTLLIYPFSAKAFRVSNYNIVKIFWLTLVLFQRHFHGLKVVVTGDEIPYGKQALVVCNHQTMPDIPVLLALSERAGCVGGMRFFVKFALKYIPFLGWGMQFLDFIFVKRAWAKDREFILRMFANLRTYTRPIWVINYSEGTRSTPAKILRSQEHAKKAGLPLLTNVLLPRPKGFVETMKHLRDRFDFVYDVTIGYPVARPKLLDLMGGRMREVHCHVRCYTSASLPEEDEALGAWLIDRFVEKDRRMHQFAMSGNFNESLIDSRNDSHSDPPSEKSKISK